jgi:hypothetical protein
MSKSGPRDSSIRAADTDRIQTAKLLTDAVAQGRLELPEYEDRLSKAYAAQTYEQLDRLSADLPGIANIRRGACKPAPSTVLLAILTGFQRRGRWNVPSKLTMFSLFGGGVVDLRYADFTSPDVAINAYSILGGQTILLPPEVNVTVRGVGVLGGFDHPPESSGVPGAPNITINGFSFCGAVGVRRKPRRPQTPDESA